MTTRSMMIFQFIICWLLVQPSLQAPSSDNTVNPTLHKCEKMETDNFYISCHLQEMDFMIMSTKFTKDDPIWNKTESTELKNFVLKGLKEVRVTFVPSNVLQSFENLEVFEVEKGNLSIIGEKTFSDMQTIKRIKLEQAGITALDSNAFENMGHLEEIHLQSNNITEINAQVFIDLPALQKLYLNKNKITKISEKAFEYLVNLTQLDLSENEIKQLNNETFYGLENLMNLDLTNNNLTKLENEPFTLLTNLKSLNLSSNKMETIINNTFHSLENLETLDLSDNKLILPNIDLFINTIKVNYLDLSGNDLKIVQFDSVKSVFQNFNESGFVNLKDNNIIICDCELSWLLQFKNESQNELLRTSLANLFCFLEENKETVTSNTTEITTPKNETNNAGIMVDGKRGHMKQLSELDLEGLPCPKKQPEIMNSSQSSISQENAQTSEPSSSVKVQVALGIFIFTLTTFLL